MSELAVRAALAALLAISVAIEPGSALAAPASPDAGGSASYAKLRDSVEEQRDALRRVLEQQQALEKELERLRAAGAPEPALTSLSAAIAQLRQQLETLADRQEVLEREQIRLETSEPAEPPRTPPVAAAPPPEDTKAGGDEPVQVAQAEPGSGAGEEAEAPGTEAEDEKPVPRALESTPGTEAVPEAVGRRPEDEKPIPRALESTLLEVGGVLTPKGTLVLDPSLEYLQTSVNRFSARGVLIVDAILLGLVEALQFDSDGLQVGLTSRYGITNRLEVSASVPYSWRRDEVGTTLVGEEVPEFESFQADGSGLGDVEFGARYQINQGYRGRPFYVAGVRVKAPTGTSPFEVERNSTSLLETELPTGSGFWGVEPTLSFIYPSDPAVLFANIGYLANIPGDVDETVAPDVHVGHVDPGDALRVGIGFGLALNQKLSVNFGATYDRIFDSKTEINGAEFKSDDLSLASFNIGGAYRWSDRFATNVNFFFGATDDSADFRVLLHAPFWIPIFGGD